MWKGVSRLPSLWSLCTNSFVCECQRAGEIQKGWRYFLCVTGFPAWVMAEITLSLLTWFLRLWSRNVTLFPFLVSCLPVVFSDASLKTRGTRPCVLRSETCWLPSLGVSWPLQYLEFRTPKSVHQSAHAPSPNYHFLGSHLEPQAGDAISQITIACGQARVAHPTGTRQLQGQPCVGSGLGAAVAAAWAFWALPWELPHSLGCCCEASERSLEMTPDSCSGVADPGSLLLHEVFVVVLLKGAMCWAHPLAPWGAEQCKVVAPPNFFPSALADSCASVCGLRDIQEKSFPILLPILFSATCVFHIFSFRGFWSLTGILLHSPFPCIFFVSFSCNTTSVRWWWCFAKGAFSAPLLE